MVEARLGIMSKVIVYQYMVLGMRMACRRPTAPHKTTLLRSST
jgi:hypothetical protein